MLKTHEESNADVTIGALPVDKEAAKAFGIMRLAEDGRVAGFLEKPQTENELSMVRTEPQWLDDHGIPSKGRDYLASMGIYLFDRDVLVKLLKSNDYEDFGKEIFPMAIRTHNVQVHPFDGYWEDIGTIKSYYESNLALASTDPPFKLARESEPIYTQARQLPSSRFDGAQINQSLIADGCTIEEGAVIENSVIGIRCHIEKNVVQCTVNGIGERAGNAALEEVALALKLNEQQFGRKVNVDLEQLGPLSRTVSELTGIPISSFKPLAGEKVFHGAENHEFARLSSAFSPETVGMQQPRKIA